MELVENPAFIARAGFCTLCLFSALAARADGARRLRRLRVAQTRDITGKPSPRKLPAVKRPEGRAPAQILVGALTTHPTGDGFSVRTTKMLLQRRVSDTIPRMPRYPTSPLAARSKTAFAVAAEVTMIIFPRRPAMIQEPPHVGCHVFNRRLVPRCARLVQFWCVLACLLAPMVSVSGADLSGSLKEGPRSAKTNAAQPFPAARFILEPGDVVAFVGGADVEAAQHGGHLEALLAVVNRGLNVRFRNFGWEGDTVHSQPRDVGFPPLKEHLRRAGVSVIALQFGRTEALGGRGGLAGFISDYQKLLGEFARQTPRLVLVTPPPFENGGGWLPDLSARNSDLAEYAN